MDERNSKKIVVVCRYHPDSFQWTEDNEPILDSSAQTNDHLDEYNHPRYRRAMILKEFARRNLNDAVVYFDTPQQPALSLEMYHRVHSTRLVDLFSTAWNRWNDLGPDGQDPMCNGRVETRNEQGKPTISSTALIPGNVPLPRFARQRPSQNIMGAIGFFCTDTCTPIFPTLLEELLWDASIIKHAVESVEKEHVVYALGTHPGHHSAHDSFGGYCYLNHAALAARLLQENGHSKVAILDVDYHCGNGTASIFYEEPTVLMISLHCHPDCEYPFHSGFYDETGSGEGEGATLNLPMMPGTEWEVYCADLKTALQKIQSFGAEALVVSLGLDTYIGDPCAVRRAGFNLEGNDYNLMGKMIATSGLPTLVVQEGGYKMDAVPQAAANVVFSLAKKDTD